MIKRNLAVGIFVVLAIVLFGAGLFLIGNRHKAFTRHTFFYTEFANLDEVPKGAKVNVDGMDAGQVDAIEIPSGPAGKFRLKLTLDERLHGLIREDSLVTIETAGMVGDKFVLIHGGSETAPKAAAGSTLQSKEPFELGKLLEQADGIMKQAGGAVTDVQKQLDGALEAATTTLNNANGIVSDIWHGKGTAGMLLEDPKTAAEVQQVLLNTRQATANLNTASGQVNTLLTDVQSRHMVAKVDDTLNHARSAAQQLDQASVQVNQVSRQVDTTLKAAFGEDQYGETAGSNLRQSLANVNQATGNLADDTAALKQEFFFKGFFKHRGYESLDDLPVDPYREGKLFGKLKETRHWLAADSLFLVGVDGAEVLTPAGRAQIDQAVSEIAELYSAPLIVEGYADAGTRGEQLLNGRHRATVVRAYLETHYHLQPKNTGVIALSATPPAGAGRSSWSGVCLVQLAAPLKK